MNYDYEEAVLECFATYAKWPTFFSLIKNDKNTGNYLLIPYTLKGRWHVQTDAYLPFYYGYKLITITTCEN